MEDRNTANAASWRRPSHLRAVFVFSILMTDSRFELKTSVPFHISFHRRVKAHTHTHTRVTFILWRLTDVHVKVPLLPLSEKPEGEKKNKNKTAQLR